MAWKLAQSPKITKLIIAPGNAGTAELGENVAVNADDLDGLLAIAKTHSIDLTMVGPEQPLVNGLVDYLNEKKVRVFGPDKFASQLEGSKTFMKNLCKKNNIPTANFGTFNNLNEASNFIKQIGVPIVVKADGLASGK